MEIKRIGSQPSEKGPADYFTGEKHWHGAAATTAMTHIAIQEQLNGIAADWKEQVSEDQYKAAQTNIRRLK